MTSLMLHHIAAAIMATLALLHLIYTLHDAWAEPRYFKPKDKPLLIRMRRTTVALAPNGKDFWRTLIGFHLSHAIGVLVYAFLIELAASPFLAWMRLPVTLLGALYALIGWTCWFSVPAWGATIATVLLIASWYGMA
jgi:hypothetical protein